VAVVFTLVQTKRIRINIHKRNNTETHYKQHKTQKTRVPILPKHPHNCQNAPTYTHQQITKQVKTTTVKHTHTHTPNEIVTIQPSTLSISSP